MKEPEFTGESPAPAGDRGPGGRFLPGHKLSAPGGARDHSSRRFTAWLRAFFDGTETRERLLAKIRRDLEGDGPGTFALRALAYAYGEPRQIVELEVSREARRIAEAAGISPGELLDEARRIAAEIDDVN